jgi:chemotaxis protein MotB
MELTADDEGVPRSTRRPRWLLLGTVAVLGLGGWMATRSISSLVERTEQLEREAAESEARVAELQVLRDGMARRLRVLEQQQRVEAAQRVALARRHGDTGVWLARREAARGELESLLQPERERGAAFLEEAEGQLRVELADPLLFAPRGTALTPEGEELLTRVGAKLAVEGHVIQVAVYTDALPEPSAAHPSPTSWELSAARAVTVARFLAETVKLPPERLVAMGHALPPASAWKEQGPGMERTRRLELRLVPAPRAPGHDRPRG